MKDLHGESARTVAAAPDACLDLLADLESYPHWYPDVVRKIDVVARDNGRASRARATLHAAVGPINRDLQLLLEVTRTADSVRLTRVSNERSDRERFEVTWRAKAAGQGTRLALSLDASLDLPRLLPTGGLADSMAAGFVGAAARKLDG